VIRLIVNGDDAGIDSARNRGILAAFREGIVTSASVIARGPASEEFLEEALRARSRDGRRLGLGLHLNFTQGRPLVPGARSLAGPDEMFLWKEDLWARALAGALDPAEVRREVEAQWAWLAGMGLEPDHIDGHNHAHVLPGIAEAVADVIPPGTWVRLPREGRAGERGGFLIEPRGLFADGVRLSEALESLSERAARPWKDRLRSPAVFRGLGLLGGYLSGRLCRVLESAIEEAGGAEAEIELMVHPGACDPASVPFSASPAREEERDALRSPEALRLIRESGVALARFREVP
jgi:predicted glycoside hydrolase/deacetylase ChbG (UPF0249 family)